MSDQIEIKFSFAKKQNYLENNSRDYVFINSFIKFQKIFILPQKGLQFPRGWELQYDQKI